MTSSLKSIYKTNTSPKTYWFYFVLFALVLNTLYFIPGTAHAATLSRPPSNLGLVGYWPMDDGNGTKATDASGNGNTGTIIGNPTWVLGKKGKSMQFNGNQPSATNETNIQRVQIPDNPTLRPTTQWTVCGWVYKDVYNQTDNGTALFWKGNNNKISVEFITTNIRVNAGGVWGTLSSSNLQANQWYHICVAYDDSLSAGSLKIYLNSNLDASKTGVTQPVYDASPVYIGERGDHWQHSFKGKIDEVRLYNRALSATEISKLYSSGQVTRKQVANTGLVGYWSLNDGAGNRVVDSSGNGNNGTLIGGATWINGKKGKAVSFNGVDGVVNVTNASVLNPGLGDFSGAVWVNHKVGGKSSPGIFSKNGGPGYRFTIGGNAIILSIYDGSVWRDYWSTGAIIKSGTWQHLAFSATRSGLVTFYVDGVAKGTSDITTSSSVNLNNGASTFLIGDDNWCRAAYCGLFDGLIDDVRIYNRALSATEIQALYKQTETVVNASQIGKITNGLVGYWPFNGLDIATTTAYDRSGQGNNGTIIGAKVAQGKSGQGLSFNGSSSYVEIPNNISLNPNVFTISAWVKSNTPLWNDYGFIVSKRDAYIIHPTANSKIVNFYIYTNSWVAVSCMPSTITEWGLYTMTWDGTNIKCFINGTQGGINTPGGSVNTSDTGVIQIGKDDGLARYFNGSIDEVRIYNRALSADEIKQLYNMSK